MKRLVFWLLLLAAVAGAASAIKLVFSLKKPLPKAELIVEPSRSPFTDPIGARGLVESVNENVRIAPALPGLVTRVAVAVGADVAQGDVLVVQDTRDAEAAVAVQQAQIATLGAQLAEAEVTLAEKRDMWERMEKLIAGRVASDEEKQRTLFAARAAEAQIASVKARRQSAEAQLAREKVQLDLLTTRAPRAGRILQVNVRPGEYVSPANSGPMMILGDVERFQLRADIDESDASHFEAGMRAVAFVRGRPDVEIPLKFERIEPFIIPKQSLTGASTERVDTRVLQIIYSFTRPAAGGPHLGIYVGQQMDVFVDRRTELR